MQGSQLFSEGVVRCKGSALIRELYNVRGFDALYGRCSARAGVQQQQWAAHSFEGSDAMSRGLMLCRGGARCTGVDRGLAAQQQQWAVPSHGPLCVLPAHYCSLRTSLSKPQIKTMMRAALQENIT